MVRRECIANLHGRAVMQLSALPPCGYLFLRTTVSFVRGLLVLTRLQKSTHLKKRSHGPVLATNFGGFSHCQAFVYYSSCIAARALAAWRQYVAYRKEKRVQYVCNREAVVVRARMTRSSFGAGSHTRALRTRLDEPIL